MYPYRIQYDNERQALRAAAAFAKGEEGRVVIRRQQATLLVYPPVPAAPLIALLSWACTAIQHGLDRLALRWGRVGREAIR